MQGPKRVVRPVAELVYEWRTGAPLPAGQLVRHKDGNLQNCDPDNLYLGKRYARKRKLVRFLEFQRSLIPGNHRVVGVEEFGEDEVADVLTDAQFFAADEVFVNGASPA
jgi:hypothetical protein